jgi:hypothetical protein
MPRQVRAAVRATVGTRRCIAAATAAAASFSPSRPAVLALHQRLKKASTPTESSIPGGAAYTDFAPL